jgi:hypothetical protein
MKPKGSLKILTATWFVAMCAPAARSGPVLTGNLVQSCLTSSMYGACSGPNLWSLTPQSTSPVAAVVTDPGIEFRTHPADSTADLTADFTADTLTLAVTNPNSAPIFLTANWYFFDLNWTPSTSLVDVVPFGHPQFPIATVAFTSNTIEVLTNFNFALPGLQPGDTATWQFQLVAAPVPEPATRGTMALGLAVAAGAPLFARLRRKQLRID